MVLRRSIKLSVIGTVRGEGRYILILSVTEEITLSTVKFTINKTTVV